MNTKLILPALLLALGAAAAQDEDSTGTKPPRTGETLSSEAFANLQGKVDGLNESYLETKTTVDKLSKIKVSGYIQTQWQYADSPGVASVAGGNFFKTSAPATANAGLPVQETSQERFQLRRGRVKTTYDAGLSQYVLQIDVIPAGVTIKDAYGSITEPWLKAFTATAGVFDRPFGFEIGYSSSSREMPERTRMYQTLFPGERDLGAKLEFKGTESLGLLQYINLKGGLFTGMGPTANEIDNRKDFIGRAGFAAPFYDINLAIDGGFSVYRGKVTNITAKAFETGTAGTGDTVTWKALAGQGRLDTYDRNIMGADAQLYYDIPVIGGLSLRGEYLWGEQPSNNSSSAFYAGDTNGVYNRNVEGWYIAGVQNIGAKLQAVARYDLWDPNTDADADDIGRGAGTRLTAADIAYTTLGLGGVYHWDEYVKFVVYYDKVENEEINASAAGSLAPFKKDLSDDIWTVRMQVKF